MVGRIYPLGLQLNEANASDSEVPFLDLPLSISIKFVSSKKFDKRSEFDYDVVNFPFWMETFHVLSLTGFTFLNLFEPGRVAQSVGHLTRKSGVLGSIPGLATYFRFSFSFFKKGSCQLLAKVCATA